MRILVVFGLVVLAAALVWALAPARTASAADQPVIEQKLCPVTGNPINPKIFVDYKGRRIYFCCPMCPPVFNKDPEKYIKIVDEQLKKDKEAKPAPPPAKPGA